MNQPLESLSDEKLAKLASTGDRWAFEQLYERHCTVVARTLAAFAGYDKDVIDDLSQEVFFRVINGLAGYEPYDLFRKWLYTIVLNVGRNYVRSLPDQVDAQNPCYEPDVACNPEYGNLEAEIIMVRIINFTAKLPGRLREVLSLRINAGMSFAEIGEMLAIPESTARNRMHRAIKVLREKFGIIRPVKGVE